MLSKVVTKLYAISEIFKHFHGLQTEDVSVIRVVVCYRWLYGFKLNLE